MTLKDYLESVPETQAAIAARVGISQTAVGSWRLGKCLPHRVYLPALSAVLGRPVEELAALVADERKRRKAGQVPAYRPQRKRRVRA